MQLKLQEIKMNLNGIELSCLDLPSSMTPYGTREVILKNEFKFDLFPIEDGSNYVEVGSHNGLLGFYAASLFPKANIHLFECNAIVTFSLFFPLLRVLTKFEVTSANRGFWKLEPERMRMNLTLI